MIEAIATREFEATASGAPAGLVGAITFQVYDPSDGTVIVAARTTGITEPMPGTYRTTATVLSPGIYLARWAAPDLDPAEEEVRVAAVSTAPLPAGVAPTIADVAAWLRARTKTRGGAEAGTFNPATVPDGDQTRPTAEQVQILINDFLPTFNAVWGVIPDAPGDDIDAYRNAVGRLASLGVALEVELQYFPEQVATRRSPYPEMLDLYNRRFANMLSVLGLDKDSSGEIDAGGVEGGYPSYGGFPLTAIGMEFPW